MAVRTFLAVVAAILLAGLAAPAPRAQEAPAGLAELAYLARTRPAAALAQAEEMLARLERAGDAHPRVVFDLYRLVADLLLRLGRAEEAAPLVARLADYAARLRARLDIDPVPLYAEAAALAERAGDLHAARRAMERLLDQQRAGAVPAAEIARTLHEIARLAELTGDAAGAGRLRARAGALLTAPAAAPTRSEGSGYRAVEVFYATDRARTGRTRPAEFYGNGRGRLELGIATVTIPDSHVPGMLEAPSVWRLEFRADPVRHVVLQSVEPLDPGSFFGRLRGEFERVPEREAFVFVHGYNVTFDQAARRAAQIAYDMNYAGVPILYSWPSWGSTIGYVSDAAVVRLSGRRLSRFLEDLVEKSGARTIHLVAHSMGNRALTDALELLALRRGIGEGDAPLFGQVLFAAPDIDAGLFREMLPTIRPVARRLTLYASEQDWALTTSRKLHGNAPRAGMGGELTLTDPAIDSIDMSELGEDMLAHSYFADDSSALADMMTLFWRNTEPGRRCGLTREKRPGSGVPVWRYRRGVCPDRVLINVLALLRSADVESPEEALPVLERSLADRGLVERLAPVVAGIVRD